ncbi:MAG: ParB/RepB/Spo0J family partition protein, partial [Pseudomonadota bacterium]
GPEPHAASLAARRASGVRRRAKLHEVPVLIRTLTDEETAEIALIENVQRVDLNPMEEAEAYQRLAEVYKRKQDEIARAVGKSRSHVANIMRLLSLPAPTRQAVAAGDISMGHARALLAAPDPEEYCKIILRDGLSVRQTEALVKGDAPKAKPSGKPFLEDKKPAAPGKKDADTRALEADLAEALGLEVEIDHSRKGAGSVTIRYLNLDQLDDVCRRLMGSGV